MKEKRIKIRVPLLKYFYDKKEFKAVKEEYIEFLHQARAFLKQHCDHYISDIEDPIQYGDTKEQIEKMWFGPKGCLSSEEGIMEEFHQDIFDGGIERMGPIYNFFKKAKVSNRVKAYAFSRYGCFTNHST